MTIRKAGQRGATLVEMMLVVGLLAITTVFAFNE